MQVRHGRIIGDGSEFQSLPWNVPQQKSLPSPFPSLLWLVVEQGAGNDSKRTRERENRCGGGVRSRGQAGSESKKDPLHRFWKTRQKCEQSGRGTCSRRSTRETGAPRFPITAIRPQGRQPWFIALESGTIPGAPSFAQRIATTIARMSCGHQKTTGRAPCDAQPGCECDCESLRVSGRSQPTTLKQSQRPHDECQNTSEAIRVDLGDG